MSLADDLVREAAKAIHHAEVDRYRLRADATWEQALDTTKAEYLADARAAVAAVLDALAANGVYRDLSDPAMDFEALAELVREVSS